MEQKGLSHNDTPTDQELYNDMDEEELNAYNEEVITLFDDVYGTMNTNTDAIEATYEATTYFHEAIDQLRDEFQNMKNEIIKLRDKYKILDTGCKQHVKRLNSDVTKIQKKLKN